MCGFLSLRASSSRPLELRASLTGALELRALQLATTAAEVAGAARSGRPAASPPGSRSRARGRGARGRALIRRRQVAGRADRRGQVRQPVRRRREVEAVDRQQPPVDGGLLAVRVDHPVDAPEEVGDVEEAAVELPSRTASPAGRPGRRRRRSAVARRPPRTAWRRGGRRRGAAAAGVPTAPPAPLLRVIERKSTFERTASVCSWVSRLGVSASTGTALPSVTSLR